MTDGTGSAFAIGADGKKRWDLPGTLKLSEEVTEAILISEFGRSVDTGTNEAIVAAYQERGSRACWSRPGACQGGDGVSRPDLGVVAISVDDGTPVWSTVVEPALRAGDDPDFIHYKVKVATDTAVLVEITPALGDPPDRTQPPRRDWPLR